MIKTPFYLEAPPGDREAIDGPPSSNHHPYDLFSVKTRLTSELRRNFPEYTFIITIEYKSYNQRTTAFFKLDTSGTSSGSGSNGSSTNTDNSGASGSSNMVSKGGQLSEQELDQIQGIVDRLATDTSRLLFFDVELTDDFPKYWLNTVMPALVTETETLTKIYSVEYEKTVQIRVYGDSQRIYLAFSRESIDDHYPYTSMYNTLTKRLHLYLLDLTAKGVIYIPGRQRQLLQDWSLIPYSTPLTVFSETGLFRPDWSDQRFAPNLRDFMLDMIQGTHTVTYYKYLNHVQRHAISEALLEEKLIVVSHHFEFRQWQGRGKVICQFNSNLLNLESAQRIAAVIDRASDEVVGEVETFEYSEIEIAQDSAQDLRENENTSVTIYRIDDVQLPHVVSVMY